MQKAVEALETLGFELIDSVGALTRQHANVLMIQTIS